MPRSRNAKRYVVYQKTIIFGPINVRDIHSYDLDEYETLFIKDYRVNDFERAIEELQIGNYRRQNYWGGW